MGKIHKVRPTDRDAERLASGYLCSEAMFGCYRSDDEELERLLREVARPDAAGWRRISTAAWRWHGTTASGRRVYVEVRNPDWIPGPRGFPTSRDASPVMRDASRVTC